MIKRLKTVFSIFHNKIPAYMGMAKMYAGMTRKNGATLIEMIVALVILAVGLLPLLLSMNKMIVNAYLLSKRTEAQLLAAEKVDTLKRDGYLSVTSNYLSSSDTAIIDDGALTQKPFYRKTNLGYQAFVSGVGFVDTYTPYTPTDFIKVTSTVTWVSESKVLSRSITGIITKEGSYE